MTIAGFTGYRWVMLVFDRIIRRIIRGGRAGHLQLTIERLMVSEERVGAIQRVSEPWLCYLSNPVEPC